MKRKFIIVQKILRSAALLFLVIGQYSRAQTITETFGTGANQFAIEFVEIGNPGNSGKSGTYYGTSTSYISGQVNYIYNLGKYEISREMIKKANEDGRLGLTLFDMAGFGGNGPNRPATGISWNEAAKFVNWLNTSKGFQVAYNFTTDGANTNITLWGEGQYSGNNQYRHKDAYYFLPSLDEWYKGAYGSINGDWFSYPTGSNTAPTATGGGTLAGTAVHDGQSGIVGPADVTQAGGLSPFGTMAQGGNVWEWTESAFDGTNDSTIEGRELRGGAWGGGSILLEASVRLEDAPTGGDEDVGFRVAMVPEPSALSLLAVGLGGLAMMRRRR